MHYTYDVLVLPEHVASNALEVPVKLAAGIIKHVTIIFPPGCVRLVYCTIWNSAEQLLPTNPEAMYSEDGYAVEIDCHIPMDEYSNQLYILAWNYGCSYRHLLRVMFDVQGVDEPELSKSIDLLSKVTDSMITAIKGLY